jgi:hypothetical protein
MQQYTSFPSDLDFLTRYVPSGLSTNNLYYKMKYQLTKPFTKISAISTYLG